MRIIYSFLVCVLLTNCVSTSEKKKPPVFSSNVNIIVRHLKTITDFQEIKFTGSQESISNNSYGLLIIEIINPPIPVRFKTIPEEDSTLREIGKRISLSVKSNLKDPEEYRYYNIKFTHKDHNWRNSSTTRNYVYESNSL